jgi:hypothetical protein
MLGRHKDDANFSSMNLSICALLITQPVLRKKHDSIPARHDFTINMLQAALSLRGFIFGEAVTAQGAIASFFISAIFFGLNMLRAA